MKIGYKFSKTFIESRCRISASAIFTNERGLPPENGPGIVLMSASISHPLKRFLPSWMAQKPFGCHCKAYRL